LLLQGHSLGDATMLVTVLTTAGALLIGGSLVLAAWKTRKAMKSAPDVVSARRTRLMAAAVVATPLLMPFYFDYDLLLLALPAVLFAGELAGIQKAEMTIADRWAIAAWCAFYVWQMINSEVAGKTGFNMAVPLLAAITYFMIRRVNQPASAAAIPAQSPIMLKAA
jgi:hypothetical protein